MRSGGVRWRSVIPTEPVAVRLLSIAIIEIFLTSKTGWERRMSRIKAVTMIVLASVIAGSAFAQPLKPKQAMRRDAAAAYLSGNYKLALRLYETLAYQGDASAAWSLGGMYYNGEGVVQDGANALRWYRLAVERGNDMAIVNIGMIFNEGRGVPQDYEEAARWFRRAADQGDVMAQYYLGLMFYEGHGVQQSYVQAHMWLNLATARVVPPGKDDIGDFIQKRNLVASKMTPDQITEAQKLAGEWRPSK
jgi:uncharacterized protein